MVVTVDKQAECQKRGEQENTRRDERLYQREPFLIPYRLHWAAVSGDVLAVDQGETGVIS